MIKRGIKNYFTSLKYFFTPLGTMFLGMMIGFSIMFSGIVGAVGELAGGISSLAESINLDLKVLGGELWDCVRALDWDDPFGALNTVLSSEWINETLTEILNTFLGTDFETFKTSIEVLVGSFADSVAASIVAFVLFWILGFIAGYLLIKFLIRRNIARRSLWKFALSYVLNAVLSAALVVACFWLFVIWRYSVIIAVALSVPLTGIFSLLEAYLLYDYKKVPLKSVVNFKNVGLGILTNLIIFAISFAFAFSVMLIDKLTGLFAGLAFIEIAFIVTGMNAESFVQGAVAQDEVCPPQMLAA